VNHVDETYTETVTCPFDISVHVSGSFKVVDYYDDTGFLYKTIATPGGGPFTLTSTALTQQSEALPPPSSITTAVRGRTGSAARSPRSPSRGSE
jgi:hypothetical protein